MTKARTCHTRACHTSLPPLQLHGVLPSPPLSSSHPHPSIIWRPPRCDCLLTTCASAGACSCFGANCPLVKLHARWRGTPLSFLGGGGDDDSLVADQDLSLLFPIHVPRLAVVIRQLCSMQQTYHKIKGYCRSAMPTLPDARSRCVALERTALCFCVLSAAFDHTDPPLFMSRPLIDCLLFG